VLGGAVFVLIAFVLFALWGSKVTQDAATGDAPAPVAH
jgi:hypothetical protein